MLLCGGRSGSVRAPGQLGGSGTATANDTPTLPGFQRLGGPRVLTVDWIAATSDNHFAYVTNEHSNDVSVVDLSSGSVTARIPVGKAPRKIVIQPTPGEQPEQARRPPRIVRPGL